MSIVLRGDAPTPSADFIISLLGCGSSLLIPYMYGTKENIDFEFYLVKFYLVKFRQRVLDM